MKKDEICKYLDEFEKNSVFALMWNRGNGILERMVAFEGFDEKGNPILHFRNKGEYLDIEKIGGYSSILSIQEEHPDGYCTGRIAPEEELDGMC